jgi:hypothetical protein
LPATPAPAQRFRASPGPNPDFRADVAPQSGTRDAPSPGMRPRHVLAVLLALVPASCFIRIDNRHDRFDRCAVNGDCVLSPSTCCGTCGKPDLADVVALNRDEVSDRRDDVCEGVWTCPECATQNEPSLIATCSATHCRALDVRLDGVSLCNLDSECRLRVPECCECGANVAASHLIVINGARVGEYMALVCAPHQACSACAPVYPNSVEPFCAESGHCALRPAPVDTAR